MPGEKELAEDKDTGALYIEREELDIIIGELGSNPNLKPIILMMVYTGMRISDVLGLRIKDIDFKTGEVKIRKQSSTM